MSWVIWARQAPVCPASRGSEAKRDGSLRHRRMALFPLACRRALLCDTGRLARPRRLWGEGGHVSSEQLILVGAVLAACSGLPGLLLGRASPLGERLAV